MSHILPLSHEHRDFWAQGDPWTPSPCTLLGAPGLLSVAPEEPVWMAVGAEETPTFPAPHSQAGPASSDGLAWAVELGWHRRGPWPASVSTSGNGSLPVSETRRAMGPACAAQMVHWCCLGTVAGERHLLPG